MENTLYLYFQLVFAWWEADNVVSCNNVPFQWQKKHFPTDFWPGFCWSIISTCVDIKPLKIHQHAQSAQVWMSISATCSGRKDDDCVGQKLRMTLVLHRAPSREQDRAPQNTAACITPTAVPLYSIYAETIEDSKKIINHHVKLVLTYWDLSSGNMLTGFILSKRAESKSCNPALEWTTLSFTKMLMARNMKETNRCMWM